MMLIHDCLINHTLDVAAERSAAWHTYEDKNSLYNETLKRYTKAKKEHTNLKQRNQYNMHRQQIFISRFLQPCKRKAIENKPIRRLAAFKAGFAFEFILGRERQQVQKLQERMTAIRVEIKTARAALVQAGNHRMNVRCYANSIKGLIKETTTAIDGLSVSLAEEEERQKTAWRDAQSRTAEEAVRAGLQGFLCEYCHRQKWQGPKLPIARLELDL